MSSAAPLLFFIRDAEAGYCAAPHLPEGVVVDVWRPRDAGPWPPGLPQFENRVWQVFDRIGVFDRPECGVLMLRKDGAIIHRSLVTPRWYRFPDMAPNDLQIGAVWSHPLHRGRGLAKTAIAEIQKRWARRYRRLWYIVDQTNKASIRVIEACGFSLLGSGTKTAPLGLGLIGQYRMTKQEK